MTPKEKAVELYNNYYQHVADGAYPESNAKQCALICVDEIKASCVYNNHKLKKVSLETYDVHDSHFLSYWQEVKKEIENL
jgi:hypothetical protein